MMEMYIILSLPKSENGVWEMILGMPTLIELNGLEETMDLCKELELSFVELNMHMNHGIRLTLPDRKEWLFEHYKDTYIESMKNFKNRCEAAIGDSGVKICIENTDGYLSYEREALTILLESKAFRLTWDIGHSHTCENVDETKTVDGLRKSVKWMRENEYMVECPCKRLKCERHGDCAACREHHNSFKRKMNVACDRLKIKREKENKKE